MSDTLDFGPPADEQPTQVTQDHLIIEIPAPVSRHCTSRSVVLYQGDKVIQEIQIPVNQPDLVVEKPEPGQSLAIHEYMHGQLTSNRGFNLPG